MPIPQLMRATVLAHMVLAFLFLSASLALGQTPREIQDKMRERLPRIDALKKEHVVGENKEGLLEILKPLRRDQKELVRSENADRTKIYEALAARTSATAREVGVIRGRQIAERSARGVMIEDESGQWIEKE